MKKKTYIVPVVQQVVLGLPKDLCGANDDPGGQVNPASNGSKSDNGGKWAPTRVKLYF